jgi:hypothetical protein
MKLYGVKAVISAASFFGAASSWVKGKNGKIFLGTKEDAEAKAREWNSITKSPNVHYYAAEWEDEQ